VLRRLSLQVYLDQESSVELFVGLAVDSIKEVDASCWACEIPWLRGMIRGGRIHQSFAARVNNLLAPSFNSEISYLDGLRVSYGTKGSVRADAVYGDIDDPKFVIELKTGSAYVTNQEIKNYYNNLPKGTLVISIEESNISVP
jgi:hypothetical protein